MTNISYQLVIRRQNLYKRIYAVISILLLAGLSVYIYVSWGKYSSYKQVVDKEGAFIEELRTEVQNDKAVYESKKDKINSFSNSVELKLEAVFPVNDNYTELTRLIDSFEASLNKRNSVFEVSSLSFQSPRKSKDGTYHILPLNMSIRASRSNFNKFLHWVENSGTLSDKVRLMSISSIRLNFPNVSHELNEPEIISFTVQLNAYFQGSE